MTVQELIDLLEKVEDKSILVNIGRVKTGNIVYINLQKQNME